jgi:hypothetical protein
MNAAIRDLDGTIQQDKVLKVAPTVTREFGNTLAGLKVLSSEAEIPSSLRETLVASVCMYTGCAD